MNERMELLSGSHAHGGRTRKVTDANEESLRGTWRGHAGGEVVCWSSPLPLGVTGPFPALPESPGGHREPEIWVCIWNLQIRCLKPCAGQTELSAGPTVWASPPRSVQILSAAREALTPVLVLPFPWGGRVFLEQLLRFVRLCVHLGVW